MKRTIIHLLGTYFFNAEFPLFVNRATETFEMTEHTHDFIEITYICEGSGVHYIQNERIQVFKGDIFFIPVGVSHVFRPAAPRPDRKLVVYNCILPVEYAERLMGMFPDAAPIISFFKDTASPWLQVRDTGPFLGWFKDLYREFNARMPGYTAVLTSLVVQILVALHRQRLAGLPAAETEASHVWPSMESAVRYIQDNYAATITLKDLARQFRLSERQFSRQFRQQNGVNFSTFLQNVRVEAACRLLKDSRMSVQDIASSVGYNDLKFFHQLFKRITGVTPLAYRKQE